MNKGLDLIQRQQPEFINDFPTGNICIGVTEEELIELEKELKEGEEAKEVLDIIIKKKVNIQWITTDTLNSYNNRVRHYYPFDMQTLTETEFNKIKELS